MMWYFVILSLFVLTACLTFYLSSSYLYPVYLEMKKSTTRHKPKNPKGTGDEVAKKKPNSGSSTNSQIQQNVLPRGLEEQSGKTQAPRVDGEQRFTFDHDIRGRTRGSLPARLAAQFNQKQILMSVMHEKPLLDVLFVPGLRRYNTQVSDGDSRMAHLVCPCATDTALFRTSDAYLLLSICKKPSVLPAADSHPRNLRILLNDQMVQGIVPSGIKPYPQVPLEIPVSALKADNVLQIYWLESTAEELAVDYCLYMYLAKRKSVPAIVASIETNLLTITESLTREYNRAKDTDIMAGPRTLHLNDPISRQRIVLPVRGKQCRHLECFDAASFVSMNFGPAARFSCPLCAQIVLPQDLVVDQFFLELLRFTTGHRIELLQDAKGITVRECATKAVQPVRARTGGTKKDKANDKKASRWPSRRKTIMISDDIDLNESLAILDPVANIADQSVMILD